MRIQGVFDAGHSGSVFGALADGRLLSWAGDNTLRLWATDGAPLAMLDEPVGSDKARIFGWARAQGFDANVLYAYRG